MLHWRNKRALIAGGAVLLIALPAIGQEAPESLLPPGFGEQEPAPPPPPSPPAEVMPSPSPTPSTAPAAIADPGDGPTIEELTALLEALPPPVEIPPGSRRPVDTAGVLGPDGWGMADEAWGSAGGRFLSSLMRRVDAPVPSRWMHIVLRRALLSRVPAPAGVNPVDWTAERAWLLLRMGEADGARMLVQGVDVDRFTPKMFSIAVQTALANADPAALCPLVEPGRETSDEPVWPLADAMCSAIRGEASEASVLIDRARRQGRVGGIDITLAEKIVGSGANTRRAVTVQWDDVDAINSWRFGLASATGLEIPDRLINGAGAHVRAWQARAAMLPIEQRLTALDTAAGLGVLSSAALVETYSLIADGTDPADFADSIGGRLRRAYVAPRVGDRMAALRAIWGDGGDRHARRILTGTAATRIAPAQALQGDAVDLIAAMLAAGHGAPAARWSAVVGEMEGADADRAWAMLAVGTPQPRVAITSGRIGAFRASDESNLDHRTQMLVAALAGLGRIDEDDAAGLAEDLGYDLDRQSRWTQMLERAVQRRQPATVALLAAAGMQTRDWRGVPPAHLYRVLSALRRVGFGYEARMIAAEAMARL